MKTNALSLQKIIITQQLRGVKRDVKKMVFDLV